MAVSTRIGTIVLAVVASALTVTGIVLAATDSNPSRVAQDNLALNGYPPSSANVLLNISTGQAYNLTANVNVNFATNAVDAVVRFPLMFALAAVDLRFVDNHLYVGSADASSGPWFGAAMTQPSLYGLSLELTKPDIGLIHGFDHETITKSGFSTIYVFTRANTSVSNPMGPPSAVSRIGLLRWSITVGRQGEVSSSILSVKSKSMVTTISAVVLSYNHSPAMSAPPANEVKPVSVAMIRSLLAKAPFNSLLLPQNLTSLGQLHLN